MFLLIDLIVFAVDDAVHMLDNEYDALPSHVSWPMQLLAGALAGIGEHSVVYPIDMLKTRMQALIPHERYSCEMK